MNRSIRHVLVALDEQARTGLCLQCGMTHLHRKQDRWRCGNANVQRMRQLRAAKK